MRKNIVIICLLSLCLLCGCGQTADDLDVPTIVICSVHSSSPQSKRRISEAISKITLEKVGCNVEIIGYGMGRYNEELLVHYQSNNLPDAFAAFENSSYEAWIDKGAVIPLNDILEPYREDLNTYVQEEGWLIASLNNNIYGIPSGLYETKCMGFVFRRDISEELGIHWREIDSLDKLHEMLLAVKKEYPDMDMIVPHGGRIIPRLRQDRLCNNIGVLVDKSKASVEVEDLYSSNYFYELCLMMRQWNEEGLFMDKAYRGMEDRQSYLSMGNAFGGFLNLSEISIYNLSRDVEYPLAAVQLSPRVADSDICNLIWCISKDSQYPELTMEVLYLMYTDKEISQLLVYGEEGIDYTVSDDGQIKMIQEDDYQEIEKHSSKRWSWPAGVEIDSLYEEEDLLQYVEFWDEPVKKSPALGFLFDASKVRTEVDACQNIIDKYESPLLCGELWPVSGLETFQGELREAGIERVIEEKQRQLDEFLKNK